VIPANGTGVSAFSGISLASGSQSGIGATGSRGIMLASIPQITSLESLKSGPTLRVSSFYNVELSRSLYMYKDCNAIPVYCTCI